MTRAEQHVAAPEVAAIGAHGAIGNMRTVALVSTGATIDHMCYPNLDSPAIFCALLDRDVGGFFTVAPRQADRWTSRQIYIPDTNVLVTRFMDGQAVVEVTDYMPILRGEGPRNAVVRRVICIRGEAEMELICAPRFDYGRDGVPGISLEDHDAVFTANDEHLGSLRLRGSAGLVAGHGAAQAAFTLGEDEQASFILECGRERASGSQDPHGFADISFADTIAYWQSWSAHSSYRGRWREYVMRSALVLKLLSSADHGSIAAAATFGLPERAGGERNWDYRFCWIRDAAFATFALMRLGYVREAGHFNRWMAARSDASSSGGLQILYRLDGRADAEEQELDHLGGYRHSLPVRIGNNAADQLQLDIYGALFDSLYLSDKYGASVTYQGWERMARTLNWLCDNWERADAGIWESRGEERHYLSSRLMCWVAFDRGLRIMARRSLPTEGAARWEDSRTRIYRDVHENFWNEERGAFTQFKGGATLDAAALLMPLMRFIPAHDPRWLSTQRAIERELASDVLVRRYETRPGGNVDGLDGEEGTFTPCGFWLCECLARSGDIRRARLHFEKLVSYANEVGLLSEEIGPGGEQLGNTPQVLTHLALISAAYTLDSELDRHGPPMDSWRQYG